MWCQITTILTRQNRSCILAKMPKQTLLIAGGVIVVIIIGTAGFFLLKKPVQTPQESTTTQQTQPEESQTKGSIKNLLAAGKNQTCTIKYPAGEQTADGTVFVSGKNFRGDFTMTSEEKTIDSHMIQDEAYMYSWSSLTSQGIKIKIAELEKLQASTATESADLNQESDMTGSAWSFDNSKFTPPADINFVETGTIPSQTQKLDPSICDQITDPQAKASCLQSLGGN